LLSILIEVLQNHYTALRSIPIALNLSL